jgi:hypothetical protein
MSYDLLTKGAHGGRSFSRGALYALLQNRLYRGEIGYKGEVYPGEHEAIVDERLWDAVQATLAANRVDRATGALCALSRTPTWKPTSSFLPSGVAPISTSMHSALSSIRACR